MSEQPTLTLKQDHAKTDKWIQISVLGYLLYYTIRAVMSSLIHHAIFSQIRTPPQVDCLAPILEI